MTKFKIKEVRDIVKGFVTETFYVEAENMEEAKRMVRDREIDADDYDTSIEDTEFNYSTCTELENSKAV